MGSSPDSSTTDDLFDIEMILILTASIISFGRMCLDFFIVAVNCREWMRKKHLSPTDKILILQGGIRICSGNTALVWFILSKFCPWIIQISDVNQVLIFIFWYSTSCHIWFTASLCSYYCVKIADFSHPFFIQLKLRLSSGLVSAWLLGSAILSLATSLPFAFSDFLIPGTRNFSDFLQSKKVTDNYTIMPLHTQVLLGLGYFAAFSICATSAVLLLFSLWRHRQRMRGSRGGHRSPQDDAHSRAVIIILSLLVNHLVIFISIVFLLSKSLERNSIACQVAVIVLYICFTVESLISLWGNKKSKNKLLRYLYFAKCGGSVS